MNAKYSKQECIDLIVFKAGEIAKSGDARFPKKSDFSEEEVAAIKAHLGPWPRALEAAGIKPPRNDCRHERTVQKRIRAKRRRREAQKEEKEKNKNEKP